MRSWWDLNPRPFKIIIKLINVITDLVINWFTLVTFKTLNKRTSNKKVDEFMFILY